MADRGSDGLPYGHFGQAIYDRDERCWLFGRTPNPGHVFRPLGEPKLLHGPAPPEDRATKERTHGGPQSERYARQIGSLIKAYPEVCPASSLLSPLLRTSEAVISATAQCDPLKGSLLAVGSIASQAAHRTIRVVAFGCGPTGSDLRVLPIHRQKQGWDGSRDAWIEAPVIHGQEAIWRGEGAAIQQVCFAHALEGSDTFLAVRMTTRTLIFRPTFGKDAYGSSVPKLAANPLCELLISMTGGLPHADAAFNPWYVRQSGVVDQAGRWSIWELEGRADPSVKPICEGRVSDEETDSSVAVADGWARITWVCDPSVVAVSTRRHLALFKVTEQTASSMRTPVLDTEGGNAWILDVVLVPLHFSYLCVLTSELILLYKIDRDSIDVLLVKVAYSLKHYRSPEDVTLSLILHDDNGETIILLRSSVNPVVVSFRFRIEDERIVAFDAADITLPKSLAGLHFSDAQFCNKEGRDTEDGIALRYRDQGVHFQNLLYLRKDLALLQQLYSASPFAQQDLEVVPPTWEAALPAKSSTKLREESFVVDDEDEDVADMQQVRARPSSLFVQRRALQVTTKRGGDWTLSFELTAQELENAGQRDTERINRILDAAEAILQQQEAETKLPLRTLRELGKGELTVGDVEEASSRLQELALVEPKVKADQDDGEVLAGPGTRLVMRSVTTALHPGLRQQAADMSMSAIYDSMVGDWISPLSADVSGRTRLAKERLVRRAAAEVTLASRVIRVEDVEQQPAPESQQSGEQIWELPVRGGMPSSSQSLPPSSQYLDSSSQLQTEQSVLPTPSPSATPSVTTGSSHPSTFVAPAVARLARYTTFSKSNPSALPRSLNNVLAHWHPGTDPATYDWLSTSRRIARRNEDEEGEQTMTEKERARMQRRAERHLRRQRKEAAASQAAQLASSQAPEIAISASQQQHIPTKVESQPVGVAGSSQSQGLGMPSASQVVPGRFGGRPPKKKRKQGF